MMNTHTYGDFRSLLTFQLLFGGRLVIRDSDYVHCRPLRLAVQGCLGGGRDADQQFLHALVSERYLGIARRAESSLSETTRKQIESAWVAENADWVLRKHDTDYIDHHLPAGSEDTFSLDSAAERYSTLITRFLEGNLLGRLRPELQQRLLDGARQLLEAQGSLRWEHFNPEGDIWQTTSLQPTEKERKFVYEVLGQAPHAGFIPDALGINPIYMNDVAEAIALWRGRLSRGTRKSRQSIVLGANRFSFSDYSECLRHLTLADIMRLVTSSEGEAYFVVSGRFAAGACPVDELVSTHYAYRARIDEAITRRMAFDQPDRHELIEVFTRKTSAAISGECLSTAFSVLGLPPLLLSLGVSLFQSVVKGVSPEQQAIAQAREAGAVRASRKMSRLQSSGNRLEHEIFRAQEGLDRQFAFATNDIQIS
jgi:hypothetical protein